MQRILVLTSILPINELTHKKDENDIQFIIEDNIKNFNKSIEFEYVYVQTYSNSILGRFSKRWKEFSEICKLNDIQTMNRKVSILPVFQLPKRTSIRNFFIKLSILKYRKRIDRLIKDFNPTVIHAQNADSNGYIAKYIKRKYNIPYIITLRGINNGIDSSILENIRYANDLIAISPTQIKDLNKVFAKEINLIPHGIDDKFFIENNYNINVKSIKIVIIARLIKLKNIDRVIKALSKFSNFSFDIIGDGPEKVHLENLACSLNINEKINFLGKKSHDEILNLLPNYNLFIQLSYPESLGRVYLEVMAAGIPIIASKNTGIDGIITNGREGFLLNYDSENELIECLKHITRNPLELKTMGINAKKLTSKFRWDEISQQYIKVYTGN